MSILSDIKSKLTSKKDVIQVILDDYEIDDINLPSYSPREIIEIDEFGDKSGTSLGEYDTPDWAKISIKNDKFWLKKRTVNSLPSSVIYRKLKLKS